MLQVAHALHRYSELRQNASRYLGEVRRRETVEVTERGEPVARLAPIPPAESTYDRLVAEGRIIPGTQNWEDLGPRWSPSRGCPSPARSSPRRARMSVERRYLDSLALVKM